MYSGILNIYKESGFTSHDVVAKLRGILKMKKIGHTGTLDPDARGVLPVCLGSATRLCDMIADRSKVYQTVLLLGRTTDTQDTGGRTLELRPVDVSPEQAEAVLREFTGDLMQVPPMYSALKVNGRKLYELAREGKTVERKPRPVQISRIEVDRMELPRIAMTVHCSKGTYIRTLCHDIGQRLGCGGCMEELLRTRVGRFSLEDALTLAQVEQLQREDRLEEYLLPVEKVFDHLPAFSVPGEWDRLVWNGNPLPAGAQLAAAQDGAQLRVYDSRGSFIGIYGYQAARRQYRPVKMFYTGEPPAAAART